MQSVINSCPNPTSLEQTVFLVDDRPGDLLAIQRLCESVGIRVEAYENPDEFLAEVTAQHHGCLIVDLLMPQMSGLDLYNQLRRRNVNLTTVLITGFADASSCRAGFQAGVFDFIEKDLGPDELLAVIRRALDHSRRNSSEQRIRDERWERINALTAREMDVAQLLSSGDALKEVGSKLNISVQTASKHRASIFEKLSVNNEVELHRAFADCEDLLKQAE